MKKRFLTSACALGLAACLTVPALAAGSFADVPEGAWYAAAVQEAADKSLMTGTSDSAFAPNAPVTRATVITVLWRMEKSPAATTGDHFTDVPPDAWYAAAADWAKGNGIAAGDGKGEFAPDKAVTREQLAVFLCNFAKYRGEKPAEGMIDQYADAGAIHSWAKAGMGHAVGAGLLKGGNDNRLRPVQTATRAELAVMLDRMTTAAVG